MMRNLGVAVVAALAISSLVSGSAEAAVCKSSEVSGLGKWSATMTGARISARYAWKRKVHDLYGSRYDTWWRSEDKSYGCWSDNGRSRCRVKARPCRAGS